MSGSPSLGRGDTNKGLNNPSGTGCLITVDWYACVLRAPLRSHRPVLEAHPGANTFPSVCGLTTTSFTDPSASRNTFSVSTITDGNAQAGAAAHFPPLRWPECTLSRLLAEEYDRPVTQSIATPEPSSRTIPTLDRTLVAR